MTWALPFLFLTAGAAWADQDCVDRYFPVIDVRLADNGTVEVDFQNKTPFWIMGYGLSYTFDVEGDPVTRGFSGYMLQNGFGSDAIHTHRMPLSLLDVDAADVVDVEAHVATAYQLDGLTQLGDTPLAQLLKKCEDA